MPTYMPSRSDNKQGMTALGKKGRPKTKFGTNVDPMVSSGLKPAKSFKKGGSASGRADGCACKGKTKGRIV